jgi:heparan-alpha-glucosaminide N-acetyltransferase
MPGGAGRLASLDGFRGFDILVMTFVNYIAGMTGVPFFLQHATAEMDTFTLTDVVFPGFLFIVGVAIPLSLENRLAAGSPLRGILGRILTRTAGLLFLGVIMVNENDYSAAATGLGKELWFFLAYAAVVVLWLSYPRTESASRRRLYLGLRMAAAAALFALAVIYRGQVGGGSVHGLRHSWWGILGMIGWTYLAASLVYLAVKGNRTALTGALGFMVALYIGGRHGALDFLGPVNEFVNIGSLFGSHTAIVTAGLLAGSLFTRRPAALSHRSRMASMAVLGGMLLLSGFLLRPLHGFSKIHGTESYCLATAGICCLLFMLFYWLMDVRNIRSWAAFLRPVGTNPLIAYIMPSLLILLFDFSGRLLQADVSRIFWPFWERGGAAGLLNAAAMTGLVLFLTWALTKAGIILKV